MSDSFAEYDSFIYDEMMAHPALFTHLNAKKIAIIGDNHEGIKREVAKHPSVNEICQISTQNLPTWLTTATPDAFDVIIAPTSIDTDGHYLNLLGRNGIFICQSESLFYPQRVKSVYQAIQKAGFHDVQILHFPQPNFPSGWRAAIMAIKTGTFKRIREKDIFNKSFATRYYNFDVHKAALVIPEFIREELLTSVV